MSEGGEPCPQVEAVNAPSGEVEPVPVDIFYDATPSMQGFVEGETYFNFATQSLRRAAPTSAPRRFFKVSSREPGSMTQFTDATLAGRRPFYAQGDTDLQAALDSAKTGHLTVLVTDLFQTNQDVEGVRSTIASKFIEAGQAVGVVGLRLDFDGKVYDVGKDKHAFEHSGERPVYVLVLGPQPNVTAYFERLQRQQPSAKYLIFSRHLLARPLSLEQASVADYKNMVQDRVLGENAPGQFALRAPQDSEHFAEMRLPFEARPFAPSLRRATMGATVERVCLQNGGAFELLTEGGQTRLASVAPAGEESLGGDSLRLRFQAQPTEMTGRGVYRFDVALRPRDVALPDWVEDWNMDLAKIPAWTEAPDTFEGNTTSRLKSFLSSLWRSVQEQQDLLLGRLTFYVKRT